MREFVLFLGAVFAFLLFHISLYTKETINYNRYKSALDPKNKNTLSPPSFWMRPLIVGVSAMVFGPAFFVSSLRKYDAIYLTVVFLIVAISVIVYMTIKIYQARRKQH